MGENQRPKTRAEVSMRLFSYIIAHDTGFAPNPFFGYCTLANCKPIIRKTAQVGDWIAGLSNQASGNRLIYAMKVKEILSFKEYFRDSRFTIKKPVFSQGSVLYKCGDNIYAPNACGHFHQLQSMHSKDRSKTEDSGSKKRDLSGQKVLLSDEFIYLGKSSVKLPRTLNALIVGRGHRNRFPPATIHSFTAFISSIAEGVHDSPSIWPIDDVSWREE